MCSGPFDLSQKTVVWRHVFDPERTRLGPPPVSRHSPAPDPAAGAPLAAAQPSAERGHARRGLDAYRSDGAGGAAAEASAYFVAPRAGSHTLSANPPVVRSARSVRSQIDQGCFGLERLSRSAWVAGRSRTGARDSRRLLRTLRLSRFCTCGSRRRECWRFRF